ncbi:hypothetical protein [Aquihabitans sp. McL0605]|uniref:hypothetical protein n=1 Tax=Aquihabitans sp. McL0605 TaxID=3415671 RepID=UPI003CF6DD3F
MPARTRRSLVMLMAVSLPLVLVACGGKGSSDPATTGPTDQAQEQLRDFGLTAAQAACVVKEVGAEAVIEASDMNAFADSQQYRDAAKVCIDDH